jgi:hypothetical protein
MQMESLGQEVWVKFEWVNENMRGEEEGKERDWLRFSLYMDLFQFEFGGGIFLTIIQWLIQTVKAHRFQFCH